MDPVPGTRLYRVKNPLPRAYITSATAVVDDKQALLRLFTPEVADGHLALVAEGAGVKPLDGKPGSAGTCTSKTEGLNRLEATCIAFTPGLAVFVEQYAAEWKVTVDGGPAKLLRVNHVMRGVELGAGPHKVVMTYQPAAVTGAAFVSGTAAIVLVLIVVLGVVKSSKRRKGPAKVPSNEMIAV